MQGFVEVLDPFRHGGVVDDDPALYLPEGKRSNFAAIADAMREGGQREAKQQDQHIRSGCMPNFDRTSDNMTYNAEVSLQSLATSTSLQIPSSSLLVRLLPGAVYCKVLVEDLIDRERMRFTRSELASVAIPSTPGLDVSAEAIVVARDSAFLSEVGLPNVADEELRFSVSGANSAIWRRRYTRTHQALVQEKCIELVRLGADRNALSSMSARLPVSDGLNERVQRRSIGRMVWAEDVAGVQLERLGRGRRRLADAEEGGVSGSPEVLSAENTSVGISIRAKQQELTLSNPSRRLR